MYSHRRHKVEIIRAQGEIIEILNDQLLNTRRLLNVTSLENLSLKQKVSQLRVKLDNATTWKAEEEISKLLSLPNELKCKEKTLKRRPPYPCNSPERFSFSKRSLSVSEGDEDNSECEEPVPVFKRIKLNREKKMAEEEYEKEIADLKNTVEIQAGLISSQRLSKDRMEEQIQVLKMELAKEYSLNEKYFKQNSIQQTIANISKISGKCERKREKKQIILEELEAKNNESNLLKEELAKKDREINQNQKELFEGYNKIQNLEVTLSLLGSQKDELSRKLQAKLKGQEVENFILKKEVKKKSNMLKNLARKFVKLKRDEKYHADSLVTSVKIIESLENELKAKDIILEK